MWLDPFFQNISTLLVNGIAATKERAVNLIAGSGVTITYADNPSAARTDVTILASGGTIGTRVTLEQFDSNAGSSSSYNATSAFNQAIGTGLPIELGWNRTYYLPSGVTLPAGCTLVGKGRNTVLYTDQTAAILNIGGNDVSISNLKLAGNFTTYTGFTTPTAQHGIKNGTLGSGGSGYSRTRVRDVWAENLGGAGYYNAQVVDDFMGMTLENIEAYTCCYGIWSDVRGEYMTVTGPKIFNCQTGIYDSGGNMTVTGGSITGCYNGHTLDVGDNNSHGSMTGTQLNHNGNSFLLKGAANGFAYVGVISYVGLLYITGTQGVSFSDCVFNLTGTSTGNGIYFAGTSPQAVFDGCTFVDGVQTPNNTATGGSITFNACRYSLTAAPAATVTTPIQTTSNAIAGLQAVSPNGSQVYDIFSCDNSGDFYFGGNSLTGHQPNYVIFGGKLATFLQVNTVDVFRWEPGGASYAYGPILGSGVGSFAEGSSPYSVHGDVAMSYGAAHTATAAELARQIWAMTPTAAHTVTVAAAAANAGYTKRIQNLAAFAVTFTDGTHTSTALPATANVQYDLTVTSTGITWK